MILLATVLALSLTPSDQAFYARMCGEVAAAYDSAHGGFASRSGVPNELAVELALALAAEEESPWKARALVTVDHMLELEDTVSGGFFERHDTTPGLASLEKRTDFNARRLENLTDAWLATRDLRYRSAAVRVVDYMERILLDGRGGFVARSLGDQDLLPDVNGWGIHAWLRWAGATGDRVRREFAFRSLDRVWSECWRDSLGLVRKSTFEETLSWPLLSDQVEFGRALVSSAALAGRMSDSARARKIGDLLIARFEDPRLGGFRTRTVINRDGSVRKAARSAAENARAALFLVELAHVTGEARYRVAAERTWRTFERELKHPGLAASAWALALRGSAPPRSSAFDVEPEDAPKPKTPARRFKH